MLFSPAGVKTPTHGSVVSLPSGPDYDVGRWLFLYWPQGQAPIEQQTQSKICGFGVQVTAA